MKLVGKPTILEFDPFSSETVQAQSLGEQTWLGDGRIFRYGVAGGSNTSAGKLEQAPAEKANHYGIHPSVGAAIGTNVVSVTLGATAAVAAEYTEGLLVLSNVSNGSGAYRIHYNPAISSSGTGVITLDDPIVGAALTTSTTVNLVHNTWNGFIEATTQTARPAGVSLVAGTANSSYVWLQTRGVAAVLNQGTIALGTVIVPSGSVAGAVAVQSSTFATAQATVALGYAGLIAGADTTYNPMILEID